MTKIYSFTGKFLRSITLLGSIAMATNASAQNQTLASLSNNCGNVIANFNAGPLGFTSNSIYGTPRSDSSFYYNNRRGFWTEVGEDGRERTIPPALPPAANRFVPILSTDYPSPIQAGFFDVGFVYVVPTPSVDRFNVVLIRLTTTNIGDGLDQTKDEIVAVSGFKTFTEFSSIAPTPYTDPFGNPNLTGQRGAVCIRLTDADITKGSNIRYRVEVTYNIATAGTFTVFDDLSLSNVEQSPLPVNFMGISARRADNNVEVRWDVADEINVDHYEVEKSTNGRDFKNIGNVYAGKKNVYSFTDGQLTSGAVLYRIKNVDANGRFKYSTIVRVNFSKNIVLKAFPSPAGNNVTIEHPLMASKGKINVSSADGKTIKTLDAVQGTTQTSINITGLKAGMYLIRFDYGNGQTETLKVVKQ